MTVESFLQDYRTSRRGPDAVETATFSASKVLALRVEGGDGIDTITNATDLPSTLVGGAGEDFLFGASKSDVLEGGEGDDTLEGKGGNDVYIFNNLIGTPLGASLGRDTVVEVSNGGKDQLNFDNMAAGVNVNLAAGAGQAQTVLAGKLNLVFANADTIEEVVGSGFDDTLRGGLANNRLAGGRGSDTYVIDTANEGIDEIVEGSSGGTASDRDKVDFSGLDRGVTFDLASTAEQTVRTRPGARFGTIDQVLRLKLSDPLGVENVTGTARNDTLKGNNRDNAIDGLDGTDSLEGRRGNDDLSGGLGDDTYLFVGSTLGHDRIFEAAVGGLDTLDFSGFVGGSDGIVLALGSSSRQTVNENDLDLTLFLGTSLENVIGSSLADWVDGNDRDNVLSGGGGKDTLFGHGGKDTMNGGTGDDELNGSLLNIDGDVFNGGPGSDTNRLGSLIIFWID